MIRARNSRHPISTIQRFCMEKIGYNSVIRQEYARFTKHEEVTRVAQITLNNLCDYTSRKIGNEPENMDEDRRTINFIAETDISNYLLRKGKTMINCMFNPLRKRFDSRCAVAGKVL